MALRNCDSFFCSRAKKSKKIVEKKTNSISKFRHHWSHYDYGRLQIKTRDTHTHTLPLLNCVNSLTCSAETARYSVVISPLPFHLCWSEEIIQQFEDIRFIGGSKGGRQGRAPPPGGPNSFIFMQFSAKS